MLRVFLPVLSCNVLNALVGKGIRVDLMQIGQHGLVGYLAYLGFLKIEQDGLALLNEGPDQSRDDKAPAKGGEQCRLYGNNSGQGQKSDQDRAGI